MPKQKPKFETKRACHLIHFWLEVPDLETRLFRMINEIKIKEMEKENGDEDAKRYLPREDQPFSSMYDSDAGVAEYPIVLETYFNYLFQNKTIGQIRKYFSKFDKESDIREFVLAAFAAFSMDYNSYKVTSIKLSDVGVDSITVIASPDSSIMF